MVLAIESARILNRLCEKGGDTPKRLRIKRFKSIKSEGNIWRRSRGDKAARAKAHAKSAGAQRQAFIAVSIRDDIDKRELQIDWVSLHRRRRQRIAFIQSGDSFREDAH